MRTSVVLVAFVAGFSFVHSSNAATVGSIEGEVLVNRGDGYRAVKGSPSDDLQAGTQVMVRPGGSAVITYSRNCAVRVTSGVWAVNEAPPCSEGTNFIDFTGRADKPVTRPASVNDAVTETASVNNTVTETASVSEPGNGTGNGTGHGTAQETGQETGRPYTTAYKTTSGNEPPTVPGEAYKPPPAPAEAPPPEEESGPSNNHLLIMGALVAAGAAGAAILLTQSDDDKPASP